MKHLLLAILFLLSTHINAQSETVNWINNNLIEIEDASPDSELEIFDENIPAKFANARIYGFGEATHHAKEFFDLKAKFFKYLVETQGVKVFIMEESYPAESGINEWISGGEGDPETIAENFSIIPWSNQEVVNLLAWMRTYNLDKPEGEQIRFYGMDIQNVFNINLDIRDFVSKYGIPVREELLAVIDSCANKKVDYEKSTDWADTQIPRLREMEQVLFDYGQETDPSYQKDLTSVLRALNYLIKYTYYVQHSRSEVRDLKMFENVKWIVANKTKNGKAFIWAHNEHINNKEISPAGSGWVSLGGHLKEYYKNDYYSVYFDFGKGKLIGFVEGRNNPGHWKLYEIEEPFPKTYSETLFEANTDIYFIDMETASSSPAKEFFKEEKKQLLLGAQGYNPKRRGRAMVEKRYSEICDALIYVKSISVPNYDLNTN